MELVTLEEQHFKTACRKLAEKVQHMQFRPDVIIGICTAGVYVAEEMAKSYPDARVYSISLLTTDRHHPVNGLLRFSA